MKIHEYQAKEIFKQFGIPIPEGGVAFSVDEAVTIAESLNGAAVVKAQIHAGGRGKGGGVKVPGPAQRGRQFGHGAGTGPDRRPRTARHHLVAALHRKVNGPGLRDEVAMANRQLLKPVVQTVESTP